MTFDPADLAHAELMLTAHRRQQARRSRQAGEKSHVAQDYGTCRETQLELTRRLSPWARQRVIGGPLRHA